MKSFIRGTVGLLMAAALSTTGHANTGMGELSGLSKSTDATTQEICGCNRTGGIYENGKCTPLPSTSAKETTARGGHTTAAGR